MDETVGRHGAVKCFEFPGGLSPVEASWGQAVLQLSNQNGASGLIEDHVMFWKAADQSRACALVDPRCFRETHDFDSKG